MPVFYMPYSSEANAAVVAVFMLSMHSHYYNNRDASLQDGNAFIPE
jgi:hypothetical protein